MTSIHYIKIALFALLLTACIPTVNASYRICIQQANIVKKCHHALPIPLKGQLAYNSTLKAVGLTRQTKAVEVAIPPEVNVAAYPCRIGLPHGYSYLIGKRVVFLSSNIGASAPWLVTDVEQAKHAGYMEQNNILADVDCNKYVHKKGLLLVLLDD